MSGLRAGDVFRPPRGFKRPPWGGRTWWVVGIIDPDGEAEAKGWHMLSIDEIVSTTTRGPIVIYREWLIDPDGNELPATKDWMPNRKATLFWQENSLARSLGQRKFELVESRQALRPRPQVIAGGRQ
jgi:hypothetical protein